MSEVSLSILSWDCSFNSGVAKLSLWSRNWQKWVTETHNVWMCMATTNPQGMYYYLSVIQPGIHSCLVFDKFLLFWGLHIPCMWNGLDILNLTLERLIVWVIWSLLLDGHRSNNHFEMAMPWNTHLKLYFFFSWKICECIVTTQSSLKSLYLLDISESRLNEDLAIAIQWAFSPCNSSYQKLCDSALNSPPSTNVLCGMHANHHQLVN